MIIFFIFYEYDIWSRDLNPGFTLKDCLFGGVKLAKTADPDKYSRVPNNRRGWNNRMGGRGGGGAGGLCNNY